jgi:Protein of unknown function (DUF2786)
MSDIYEFKPGKKKSEEKKRDNGTNTRAELIAKIRALLAKTVERGCTPGEAKAAAKKAKEMMQDYGITEEEIRAAEDAESGPGFDWDAFRRMFMSVADRLVDLAGSSLLFHAPDGECFADVMVDGHRETWPLASRDFRRWLLSRYFEEYESAPGSEAVRTALATLDAKAKFKGPEHSTYVRIASHGGKIYLDLTDDRWRAIEIDGDGWRLVNEPPVRFRRKEGMRPLPVPNLGSIDTLKPLINIRSDSDFVLVVSWLVAALRDRGPYPILVLGGEQGTAKSTLARVLRLLVDPNTSPLRTLPRDDRELCISAKNAFVLCYDNVSGMPNGLSDMLCRISTGGGNAVRQLYTDQDEVLFDAQRPVIMNGITDVVGRPDLAERSIFIALGPIAERKRMTEADLMARFEAERPRILGALLDAVSYGLKHPVKLTERPRMADFAEWAASCEPSMWERGTFMTAYHVNIEGAIEAMIEANPVAHAVRTFMESRAEWDGTAETLLAELSAMIGEAKARRKDWPQTARGLAGQLTRAAANLRKIGIEVEHPERRGKARPLRLSKEAKQPSQPSQPSQTAENCGNLGDGSSVGVTVGDGRRKATVTGKPLEDNENDDRDGNDGGIPHREYGHDQFSAIRLQPKVAKAK